MELRTDSMNCGPPVKSPVLTRENTRTMKKNILFFLLVGKGALIYNFKRSIEKETQASGEVFQFNSKYVVDTKIIYPHLVYGSTLVTPTPLPLTLIPWPPNHFILNLHVTFNLSYPILTPYIPPPPSSLSFPASPIILSYIFKLH